VLAGVLCWWVIAPAMEAQIVGPAAQADKGDCKLTGSVVDSLTGSPIPRALVQLAGSNQGAMLTDAIGNFEFDGLKRSSVNVMVRKPGYFSEQELAHGPRGSGFQTVNVGPDTAPLVLKLASAATVTGRVMDGEDEPIEDAQVRLSTARIINGHKRWQQAGFGTTGEDGRFRIGTLRPGMYLISVTANTTLELVSPNGARQEGYPLEWYYPGVPERSGAGSIELTAGQNFQADFTMRKQPVFRISGTMLLPPDGAGGRVELVSASGEAARGMGSHADGHFEVREVPAGNYILQAYAGGPNGHQYAAEIPISVSSDINGIVVVPAVLPTIPVVVKTEFSRPQQPQPGTFMSRGQFSPGVQVQLQGMDPPYHGFFAQQAAPDNPEPQIRGARPGRYIVEFLQNSSQYVRSATCGNIDLLREPLTVTVGAPVEPIVVTLRDDVGGLEVKPKGAAPQTGAQILIFADDAPAQPPHIAFLSPPGAEPSIFSILSRTGASDGAQIQGLAPGAYTVLAFDSVEQLEYANPEVMRAYMSRAAHASVSPGGKTAVSVDVIRMEQ